MDTSRMRGNLDFIAVSMAIVREATSENPSTLQRALRNDKVLVDWWQSQGKDNSTKKRLENHLGMKNPARPPTR